MAEHRGGSGNFAEDKEKASEAGRKGGQHSGGNFKNDPQRASEAGKKGGQNSHSGGRKSGKLILLLIFRKYILKYCTYDAGHRLAFFYSDRELF
ncbi:Conidiation-specific protein 10 [Salmonella enterica subsp. enterica]|uniref:Conidiation-specific protein 10 n=19 Tax=Salmonella enterica TaxID=28901 RepID=A0A379UPD3_SALET|nr:Conidiation-specific protein 10 [Salmonella enterica subsp. enterica]